MIPEEKTISKCSCCGNEITQGYCVNGGEEYYCSDECLDTRYSPEEWDKMYEENEAENYWTVWHD